MSNRERWSQAGKRMNSEYKHTQKNRTSVRGTEGIRDLRSTVGCQQHTECVWDVEYTA